jgi:hypothetical protein
VFGSVTAALPGRISKQTKKRELEVFCMSEPQGKRSAAEVHLALLAQAANDALERARSHVESSKHLELTRALGSRVLDRFRRS